MPRFWVAMQPSIIRLYKVAGLFVLTAILVGLIGFLVVNIFYFFDHTWVRPVVLSPTHQKVVEASNLLTEARSRDSQLRAEKLDIESQLKAIELRITRDEAVAVDAPAYKTPKTAQEWIVKHDIDDAALDKDLQIDRRAPLKARLESLAMLIGDQDALVARLEKSPYLRAVNNKVVLAFVPYQNLRNVKLGTKLYGCSWGLILCSRVGKVTATIDGEVQDIHPHDESVQRGIMVEVELSTPSAEGETVLFAGSKPLWLF
ncbi:MAG: hypothetical protein ACM31C_06895 [Acidobacteriota bacterium]